MTTGSRRNATLRHLVNLVLLAVAVWTIGTARARTADEFSRIKASSDTYTLPPAEQLSVMTLGYRAAVADFIYAHVLVSYGLHFQEKRRFEHVDDYLEAVIALDPKFADPYVYADTLLTLQPKPPRQEDYVRARELMIRGTEELPYHRDLWLTTGQYLVYLGGPHLEDPSERERWRIEGARILARACELSTDDIRVPQHCFSAARHLNNAGQRDALIRMLRRTLAVNDDEEVRRRALSVLGNWVGEQEREEYAAREDKFRKRWSLDLPHVSKERLLLLGPGFDPAACAGGRRNGAIECQVTWRDWSERL